MTSITGNLVDGRIRTEASGGTIDVTNPASPSTLVGRVPAMTAEDVTEVLEAATRGAKVWKQTGSIDRGIVLQAAAQRIREERDHLAKLITAEMGKTLAEATVEVGKAADFFEYYAAFGRLPFGELLPDARPHTYARAIHEPLGVVVLITPWNDPLLTPARKLGPALIAGNAVVIKPATVTPLIVLELARILNDCGLPAGVLGSVTGHGNEISDPLLEHPAITAVSFTGSTAVGKLVQRKMAGRSVRVQTEMGGKNAVVVLPDADLELAASNIVAGGFVQTGQRCTASSRIIAHRDIADALQQRILSKVAALQVGDGMDASTALGPVVSRDAQAEIFEHIDTAIDEGAVSLNSSDGRISELSEAGAFVAPVVLQVGREHSIWRDEVFGPVISIITAETEQEMIDAVNASDYGLSAAIFTRDLGAAERFIASIDTGQVSVNHPTSGWDVHHPFGGFKDSGSPFKEQGLDALQFYTRTKTVAVNFG